MREYKMRRGEHLEDRVPDMNAFVEDHFGPVTDSEEYKGNDLLVVENPDNPVFEHVVAGAVEYSGKKSRLVLNITERPAEDVIAEGNVEAAESAVAAKNNFLEGATGRNAKARRDSMKRSVEDDTDSPDNV